mgnify:CR=1 FL=1
MSAHDVRPAVGSPAVPRPRGPEQDVLVGRTAVGVAVETVTSAQPRWSEPGHTSNGARPRTEYWDVTTASWRPRC